MKSAADPVVKDLVLIGGGHSHVAVLKRFGMRPIPGVRITLITRDMHTPYSGMLPGLIAGHYTFDEAHIDLRPLTNFAGGRVIHGTVEGLDLDNKRIFCGPRPSVPFDVLSVNIGSRPRTTGVPGSAELAHPIKPIDEFLVGWDELVDRVVAHRGRYRIGVVGGGAGGVELTLAAQYRLRHALEAHGLVASHLEFHLLCGSDGIMPTHDPGVGARFRRVLQERGIRVYPGHRAAEVEPGRVHCENGASVDVDHVFWVTHASAPAWPGAAGLATSEEGFIRVNDCLQSLSHPFVFAAGDIADVVNHPRPKSGVFAVRQGPPLAANLRRALLGRRPRRFTPQTKFLGLISTGDQYAIASRGSWSMEGQWLWRLKDWIDRRFMAKYHDLPEMEGDAPVKLPSGLADRDALKEISAMAMRCGGCGAKVGSTVLSRVVNRLEPIERDDVKVGLRHPDDAAVVEVPANKLAVQSVDYFRAFIDDPYLFGRIAANHSLGDLFAMGAEPQSAMAIATVPYGTEAQTEEQLYQMMVGAVEALNECGAALVGGHSSEGAELAFGLSVTGLIDPAKLMQKGGMRPGETLVLTKGLGTGTLFAADMRQKAKGRWISGALDSMAQSNQAAARILQSHGASACTDVTGFGLLGHLVEMTKASDVDAELDLDAVPLLDGAMETIRLGVFSSLQPQNVRLRRAIRDFDSVQQHPVYPLLFDPQTAGGLLASVPSASANTCLTELKEAGYPRTVVIGRVQERGDEIESIALVSQAALN